MQNGNERTHIDTRVHAHRSADGRHWSSEELALFTNGEISHEEMMRRVVARDPDAVRMRKPERNYANQDR